MGTSVSEKSKTVFIAITIGWLFYLFSFFARVEPGVLVDDLMRDFSLNASNIGLIVSVMYIPYVAMQIPWGILTDKLGCRLVISLCCAICSLGVLIFGLAHSNWQLILGRFLIGFSSASAYLACGKVISETLPKNRYALFLGLSMFVGCIGGIIGSSMTANCATYFGWRNFTCAMAVVGFIIGIISFMVLKSKPTVQQATKVKILDGIKILVASSSCWLAGLFACTSYLPLSAIAELWGTPFMQSRFNVSTSDASICASVIYIGYGIGSILSAKIAEKIHSNKNTIIAFALGLVLTFTIAIYSDTIGFYTCITLFGLGSMFAGSGNLAFDISYKFVPSSFAGTSTGYTNMLAMSSGLIFQPLLGKLLDFFRNGQVNPDGSPLYDIIMYRSSFIFVLAIIVVSVIGMMFVKERE